MRQADDTAWIDEVLAHFGPTVPVHEAQRRAAEMFHVLERELPPDEYAKAHGILWSIWRDVFLPKSAPATPSDGTPESTR